MLKYSCLFFLLSVSKILLLSRRVVVGVDTASDVAPDDAVLRRESDLAVLALRACCHVLPDHFAEVADSELFGAVADHSAIITAAGADSAVAIGSGSVHRCRG